VTVGETLTEARHQAGLSVDELSERTRIRGTVIRSIEQDDYDACGGDLYVRGYVRALAGAVGIDAQPLIREFDNGRDESGDGPADFRFTPVTAYQTAAARPADADATRYDLPPVSADPAATTFDLPPAKPAAETRFDPPLAAEDLMAAGYELGPERRAPGATTSVLPAVSPDPAGPPPPGGRHAPARPSSLWPSSLWPSSPRRRRRAFAGLLVVAVVLAAAVILGVRLSSGGTSSRETASTAPASVRASANASASASAAQARAAAQVSTSASASAAAQASQASQAAAAKAAAQRAAAAAVVALPVASVQAYGPDGLGSGDDPGGAASAVARNPATPWSTQWYVSAQFGMLKHGTGLLLDLGRKVTVTGVRLDLSAYPGASLQLRVGNGTAPQDLRLAAAASNASGTTRLTLRHPAAGRYLLVWITQLPLDGSGHYTETVARTVVSGHR
jgi:cytoskeletal protein RodZ